MDVRKFDDPLLFLDHVRPLLLQDEARHNLIFGIAQTLADQPEVYPEFGLWVVEEAGEPVACAVMTPPFNLVLSQPRTRRAVSALAQSLHEEGLTLPGITGAIPEADVFASEWRSLAGVQAIVDMRQQIYELRSVLVVGEVPGHIREATPTDRALILEWVRAFSEEALPGEQAEGATERLVDARLQKEGGGFFLWEDLEPVSLVGYGGFTPNGARVGPVYTPPQHRGKGYASALTAGVSGWLLEGGRRFCFLYTNLANPTSNRIYQRIGYEPVCSSIRYRFETP